MQVPEGWKKHSFGELVKLKSEKLNKSNLQNGKFKFSIELDNIAQGSGKIIGKTDISQVLSTKNIFRKNDVLYGKLRPYLKKYANPDFEGVCSTEIWVLTAKKPVVLNKYIFLLIQTHNFNIQANITSGTKMPRASWEIVSQWDIPLPPLAEQEKIAEILSTWDDAIEQTERLKTNAEMHKKALMQQLLTGKKRFPEFGGEWEKKALKNLLQEIKKERVENPQDYELLTVRLHNKGIVRSGKYPRPTKRGRPYYFRYAGELIIGRQNLHNGGIGIADENVDGCIASNAISSFKAHSSDLLFMYYFMSTPRFIHNVDSTIGGTGQKEISSRELLRMKVTVPSLAEQQKIATVLNTADREIELLTQKIEHLKSEKRALMQQLLTGKRRVKVDG